MIAAIDNSFLCILFHEGARLSGGKGLSPLELERRRKQIEYLIKTLSEDRSKLIVPTPALAELLMLPGLHLESALERIDRQVVFKIQPFDTRAAMEMSRLSTVGIGEDKFKGQEGGWTKIKFDRQIVAIAKVAECETILTTDGPLANLAKREDLTVIMLDDLPDPPAEDVPLFTQTEQK